jgi:hypothetical protein
VKWQSQGRVIHFREEVNDEAFAIAQDYLRDAVRQVPLFGVGFGTSRISDHIVTNLRLFYGI